MRSLKYVVGLAVLGTVCLAQAGDRDAMDRNGSGPARQQSVDITSDLHLTLHPGYTGLEYAGQRRRSAAAPEAFRHDPERRGLELDLTVTDAARFGMFSSVQDETPAVELSEEPLANSGPADLTGAAQNPIANTISVPFENTLFFHGGADDETTYVLNVQPVIPVSLSDDWNLISRPIVPLMYVPGAVEGLPGIGGQPGGFNSAFGLGDINYTGFFSPSKADTFIWGVGPSITFPTATDDVLGSGKWSAGPSFVGLTIQKPIVAGVLLRHLWSFAGDSDRRSVSQSLIQPFLNYNLDDGWYLITSPIITADWAARSSSDRWTVPLGGGFGKLTRWGDQAVNMNLQLYYSVERPTNASDWQLKFTFQLLFPK